MREWILAAEAASNLKPGDKWRFYLTAGTLCPRIGRDCEPTTSSEYLRATMVIAAVKGDRTLAQLAEQFDVHTPIRSQLEAGNYIILTTSWEDTPWPRSQHHHRSHL